MVNRARRYSVCRVDRRFRSKAQSSLDSARLLAGDHPNIAASRVYYAVHNAMNMRWGPVEPRLPRDHGALGGRDVWCRLGVRSDSDVRVAARTIANLYYARR